MQFPTKPQNFEFEVTHVLYLGSVSHAKYDWHFIREVSQTNVYVYFLVIYVWQMNYVHYVISFADYEIL
jgi:hypothetical protein